MKWHYRVGDNIYYNKLEAIQENIQTNKPIHFITPPEYNNHNFSIEPEQKLQGMFIEEAKKIRDSHDVVRLYYSGGSDSELVLRTFVDNNIHIDEIICWKSGIPVADFEIDQYAIPTLAKLDLVKTKITINVSSTQDYYDYYKKGVTTSKIRSGACSFNTHIRLIQQIELFQENNFKQGVANIRGFDKPKIIKRNGKWYTYFIDVDIEPAHHTYSFFSDNPILHSKQAHLFMKQMQAEEVEEESDIWEFQKIWNTSTGRNSMDDLPQKNLFFGEADNHVLYKGKKIYYLNQKEKLALEYFLDRNPEIIGYWYENIEQLKSLTKNRWWNCNRPELGSVGIFSNFYSLQENITQTVDDLYPNGFKT